MRKKSSSRHSVYQRGNHSDGSPNNVFPYPDDQQDDENIPLKVQKETNSFPRKVEMISIAVKPDDTLQALALRYRCTISELKRINKIDKDNEIYARRFLKVPVQPFSIFTETNGEPSLINLHCPVSDDTRNLDPVIPTPTIGFPTPSDNINAVILNSMCESMTNDDNQTAGSDGEDENCELLHSNLRDSTVEISASNSTGSSTWVQILKVSILLVIFIAIALPLVYLFDMVREHIHTSSP